MISEYLEALRLGNPQSYKHVVLIPITALPGADGVDYLTLGEALSDRLLTVTEVGHGGAVPNLKVASNADKPILILDGEELAGAKQNRVLNTSILVPERAEMIVPVSCTEAGRWAYTSATFLDSGNVLASSVRSVQAQSVSRSLDLSARYGSDQGAIWHQIEALHRLAGTSQSSRTRAMQDAYRAMEEQLAEAMAALPLVADQTGFVVVAAGEAVGFDVLSKPSAYAKLHPKLVKSYMIDALNREDAPAADVDKARAEAAGFLKRAGACAAKQFKSVGHGDDYRFDGDGIAGSALLFKEQVIHAAFFRVTKWEAGGNLSDLDVRRRFRL